MLASGDKAQFWRHELFADGRNGKKKDLAKQEFSGKIELKEDLTWLIIFCVEPEWRPSEA